MNSKKRKHELETEKQAHVRRQQDHIHSMIIMCLVKIEPSILPTVGTNYVLVIGSDTLYHQYLS